MKWTEEEVVDLLEAKYSDDGHAFFRQVPDGTGGHRCRTADALCMSLWPSRGLVLHGFEVKVSRADWLKELREPEKADSIAKYCDHWWIVTPADVVKKDDLPKDWGHMTVSESGARVTVKAARREHPTPLDRVFIAGLFRAASRRFSLDDVKKKARDAGFKAGVESEKKNAESRASWAERDLARLQESLEKFERISGIEVTSYNGEQLGEAVKAVRAGDLDRVKWRMRDAKQTAEKIIQIVETYENGPKDEEGETFPRKGRRKTRR